MEYAYTKPDFDHPSLLFRLEDRLKDWLGGWFYRPFVHALDLEGHENVLDFGCGGGAGSLVILDKLNNRGRLTAVDTSPFWIERARERLGGRENADLRLGDIRDLNIPARAFDIIAVIHVIHDIPPADRESVVQALAHTLRHTGRLVLLEPTRPNHGMAEVEILDLMHKAGLKEMDHVSKKNSYLGRFERN